MFPPLATSLRSCIEDEISPPSLDWTPHRLDTHTCSTVTDSFYCSSADKSAHHWQQHHQRFPAENSGDPPLEAWCQAYVRLRAPGAKPGLHLIVSAYKDNRLPIIIVLQTHMHHNYTSHNASWLGVTRPMLASTNRISASQMKMFPITVLGLSGKVGAPKEYSFTNIDVYHQMLHAPQRPVSLRQDHHSVFSVSVGCKHVEITQTSVTPVKLMAHRIKIALNDSNELTTTRFLKKSWKEQQWNCTFDSVYLH